MTTTHAIVLQTEEGQVSESVNRQQYYLRLRLRYDCAVTACAHEVDHCPWPIHHHIAPDQCLRALGLEHAAGLRNGRPDSRRDMSESQ